MMISLLTWHSTDGVYKFSHLVDTSDADKTRQFCLVPVGGVNKPLHLIRHCSKFIEVHVCHKLFQCKKFWQSYCRNKRVQFLGTQLSKGDVDLNFKHFSSCPVRSSLFDERIVNIWNRFPAGIVYFSFLSSFRNSLGAMDVAMLTYVIRGV